MFFFKGNLNSKHPGVRVDGGWSCEDERKMEDISSKTDEEAN